MNNHARKACLPLILILSFTLLGTALPGTAQELSELMEISYEKVEGQLQVFIRVEGPFSYETFELIAPKRLVIDLSPVQRVGVEPLYTVNDIGVINIRTGQFQPQVSRIVFDMTPRLPSHSISPVENGLRVVFWLDEPLEPQVQPPPPPPAPAKPAVKKEVQEPAAAPPKKVSPITYFVRGAGGLSLFLMPSLEGQNDLELYGETGSLKETYKQQMGLSFDVALGGRINPKWSLGVGANMQLLKYSSGFEASIPHPFVYNQPRTVNYDEPEPLQHSLLNFYAFGLYSITKSGNLEFSVGPMIVYSMGKFSTIDDFDFEENAPYTSADVTIESVTYLENSLNKLSVGAIASLTYLFKENLYGVADLRVFYLDPKIESLGSRANFLRLTLLLGLQYTF